MSMQMVFSRSHRLATLLLLYCVVCGTVWVGVDAQGNCACSCCIGNGCTPSNAGQTTVSTVTVKHRWYSVFRSTASFGYALRPGHRDRFNDTTAVLLLQASSCDQAACNSAFPGQCPGTGESGACLASSISSTASSSYTSASGTISLDTSSVSDACETANSGIDYQCGKSYSVAVSGSSLTLTSTSGPGSTGGTCDIGTGKRVP